MARIRSIKPGFWTNETVAELDPWARLCFVGLWNLADREGRLEDRPRQLKVKIFPFDAGVDVEAALVSLADRGFIQRYEGADGVPYIAVMNFLKHQRPRLDEPISVIPAPLSAKPPPKSDGPVTVQSLIPAAQCNGERGERREERGERESAAAVAPPAVVVVAAPKVATPQDLADAWNRITQPPLPRCREISAPRARKCRARLAERPLAEWEAVMVRIQASSFLHGHSERGWMASFDWLVGSADVGVKVLEGKYDDREIAAPINRRAEAEADWFEQCKELHGGACKGDRFRHLERVRADAWLAAEAEDGEEAAL